MAMKDKEKSRAIKSVREIALMALLEVNRDGAYANIVLQQALRKNEFSDVDRRFFTELFYGVIRRKNYLDRIIEFFCKKPVTKLSPFISEILRLGLYQLIYMNRVPSSAAVNESVILAKKYARGIDKMINAVLRNYLRNTEAVSITALSKDEIDKISLSYNLPQWMIKLWIDEYGIEKTIDLCKHYNDKPLLSCRINTLKTSVEEMMLTLCTKGVIYEKSTLIPEAVLISKHSEEIENTDWYKQGLMTIMDEASMAVAYVVDAKPNERVLDCCAAPGGKTLHIGTRRNNKGKIVACDIHEHKLELLKNNARLLGVENIVCHCEDSRFLSPQKMGYFDKVLVDAPCSGLGVLQKKLDMRWKKKENDLLLFPPLQLSILEAASSCVKSGGTLIYSTCTINSKENEEVIHTFLRNNPDFVLEDASDFLPFETKGPMITLLPFEYGTDGFFIARMKRIK